MSAVTQWFRCAHLQPKHVGWYDVKYAGDTNPSDARHWWDGRKWRMAHNDLITSFGNNPQWRGDAWRGQVTP